MNTFVTLDHKTNHKSLFLNEMYTSSNVNNISIDVWFVMIGQYLAEIQLFEYTAFDCFCAPGLHLICFYLYKCVCGCVCVCVCVCVYI